MTSGNGELMNGFRPLDSDPAHSPTLPGYLYHRPDVLEREKTAIFYKSWQLIAHTSELQKPGDYVCASIIDQNIFVIRGNDGEVRAFYNVCQHRAHELLSGKGNVRKMIVCPYHAWAYQIDGKLRTARHCDAMPDFNKANISLTPVKVAEAMGFIFVNLDPDSPGLEEVYGDMFEDMAKEVSWWDSLTVSLESNAESWDGEDIQANWKVLVENCLECYHCQPAHPAFVDMIDIGSYYTQGRGNWLKSFGGLKKADNKAYYVDPDEPSQISVFWHIWPNMEISVLPGEAAVGAFRLIPTSSDTTASTSILLTEPDETVIEERRNYRWNTLWPEDKALCESVHKGLKSKGYSQGRFVIDPERPNISEHAVHFFQRRYMEAIG